MVQETRVSDVIALCGPTASGKTRLALELADEWNAEIVSVDSGQIYRGMDIGTAKPSPEERQCARFHLIDIIDPSQVFSAAEFRIQALAAIQDIRSRGKRVILTVGTGLYLRALTQGLFDGPSAQPELRRQIEAQIQAEGIAPLLEELRRVDPEAARGITRNRQRLIRALEVYRATGRPISSFWNQHQEERGGEEVLAIPRYGLLRERSELVERIDRRVEEMFHSGLPEEVKNLLGKWGASAPGLQLIGYKELVDFCNGKGSKDEALRLIQQHSRQYAKRQMTWFRKDPEIIWKKEDRNIREDLTKM